MNGIPTTMHDQPLQPGDRVILKAPTDANHSLVFLPVAIDYEDEALNRGDEPAGVMAFTTEPR